MRISDWSSDVCSSDLKTIARRGWPGSCGRTCVAARDAPARSGRTTRSEEHTSELQSLMRISYAVFCLKKKKRKIAYITFVLISTVHHKRINYSEAAVKQIRHTIRIQFFYNSST